MARRVKVSNNFFRIICVRLRDISYSYLYIYSQIWKISHYFFTNNPLCVSLNFPPLTLHFFQILGGGITRGGEHDPIYPPPSPFPWIRPCVRSIYCVHYLWSRLRQISKFWTFSALLLLIFPDVKATVVRISDANSKHVAHVWRKICIFWKCFKFTTAVYLDQWLKKSN